MKNISLIIISFLVMTIACKDSAPGLCEQLQDDLINLNVENVKDRLDDWLINLHPIPTVDDELGHRNNLISFVNRLNQDCDFDASLNCYACIETLPAQSEVFVHINFNGEIIQRVIDIRTPQSGIMTIVNIHE